MNEQTQPAGGGPVEQPARPQRWTAAIVRATDEGGFVAIGDYLALERAARQVVAHMEGRMPVRGWLKDNDKSREALAELVRVLGA